MYAPIDGTRVLAFGGRARAGKDTAAQFVRERAPLDVACFAFSDAISAYARVASGMTRRNPRLLQELGYAMRQAAPRVWLDALYWRIDEVRPRVAVVTGVRFPNELQLLRDLGADIAWVERVRADGTHVAATDRDESHAVENALRREDFPTVLTNADGSPETFRAVVLAWASCVNSLRR